MTEKKRVPHTPDTPETPPKPDGVVTIQEEGQVFVAELFFNHASRETIRDRLIKRILEDKDD